MDLIKKEQIISGLIGGVAALLLTYAAMKINHKMRHGGGKRGKWGMSEIKAMESANMPAAIGPYSKGKMVHWINSGQCFAWSSG